MPLFEPCQNLVYIKTGFEVSRDKATMTESETKSGVALTESPISANKTSIVFAPGAGYERAMGNYLFRFEYTYNAGKKITINDNTPPITGVGEVSYSDNRFAFGVAYKF
jgi:opacity protein-like surface antigen